MALTRPSGARLGSSGASGPRLLVVGHGALMGASRDGVGGDTLPSGIAERARDELGSAAALDVLWDLGATVRSMTALAAAGRLPAYDAVVVVVTALHVLAAPRRLRAGLAGAWPQDGAAPRVVVVLAAHDSDDADVARAEARIRELAADLPGRSAPSVIHADVEPAGGIRDPATVASAAVRALDLAATSSLRADDAACREVAVDRAVRILHGRTSHLRRALTLAQNSFDVPFAQLNLVSRGTLRSLAYVGRSSDGLERSLSAEAVLLPGPLLVADTHLDPRFSAIPEIRGPEAIRYYVGHPVRSGSGHAVGVLCVLDTAPHDIAPGDDALIRDLALLAEGELAALTEGV